ncbi:DNA polymerase III subunit chi [Pararhodobacter zhoushanensis]|uniref:DNA polymerase III subunit chi n=1 Tax=Pararhodobacter zhoushanensis TaxID=2479545 RepID=A0ABT3H190_9RHOB|nr:DNA polymerase III subunit chi [Pararhodobacter zhoushanensis]MCW1933549.1 DNA polymerase III subunit chi [Pararhodobacter zhoushanensis]
MAVAKFYHLTRDPVEALLPVLVGKAIEIGLRVAVRGTDQARMETLDRTLWQGDGFLPHGMAGGPHDADQPCLLVWDTRPAEALPNTPGCLVTLDGAEVAAREAAAVERLCVVFDGTDEDAVVRARAQWRSLTGAGVEAEYWSRESGRWECKAKHPK